MNEVNKNYAKIAEENHRKVQALQIELFDAAQELENERDVQITNAVTHAWLDLKALRDILNGDEDIDRAGWDELAKATKDSVGELEEVFPFLLEGVEDE